MKQLIYSVMFLVILLACLSCITLWADETPKTDIILLQSNQAQPYLAINEALMKIDAMMIPVLSKYPVDSATSIISDATNGDVFIVPSDGRGDWDGYDNCLAIYNDTLQSGEYWTFIQPETGMQVRSASDICISGTVTGLRSYLTWDGDSWENKNAMGMTFFKSSSGAYAPIMLYDYEDSLLGAFVLLDSSSNIKAKLLLSSGKPSLKLYDTSPLDNPVFDLDTDTKIFWNRGGYNYQSGTFASINVHDATMTQSIPTGDTYTKFTGFDINGATSNCIADATNDKITITKTGIYKVDFSCSFGSGTANTVWRAVVFVNGVENDQCHFARKITTANDLGSASFTGLIDITTASWDVDVRLRHDNGGSVNFITRYADLVITYLGET